MSILCWDISSSSSLVLLVYVHLGERPYRFFYFRFNDFKIKLILMSRNRFRTRMVEIFLAEIFFLFIISIHLFWQALLLQLLFFCVYYFDVNSNVLYGVGHSLPARHPHMFNVCSRRVSILTSLLVPTLGRHEQCLSLDNIALTMLTWERHVD